MKLRFGVMVFHSAGVRHTISYRGVIEKRANSYLSSNPVQIGLQLWSLPPAVSVLRAHFGSIAS